MRKFKCEMSKQEILGTIVAYLEKSVKACIGLDDSSEYQRAFGEYNALWNLANTLKIYEEEESK